MEWSFQFASLAEFLYMKGHGPYVWASYALTLAAIAYLAIAPVLARHKFVKQQKASIRRQQS